MSIDQLLKEFESRRLAAEELAKVQLELIQTTNPTLNVFLSTNDSALEESIAADTDLGLDTRPSLLRGIPLSVKDLFFTRNMPTTGGSRAPIPIPNPPGEARVITRLREAGAVLLGKTNLHEFAFGITNENEHYGACLNPWRVDRMTGGSSGGSAAAVAAGLGVASLGTDTRGSIRIPAALCGVSGLKPTLGNVPTHGVIPLSSTMDHVGPMARTVEDLVAIMAVIAPSRPNRDLKAAERRTKRLTLGVCDYYFENIQAPVEEAVRKAIRLFEEAAIEVVEVDLPILPEALHASDIISRAEAVSIHDGGLTNTPEAYGPLVRGRLATHRVFSAGLQ
jgi:aspartyl-tRNA(Asn)/glutamyl-tRNA(Gln) amidotransferase subunit A